MYPALGVYLTVAPFNETVPLFGPLLGATLITRITSPSGSLSFAKRSPVETLTDVSRNVPRVSGCATGGWLGPEERKRRLCKRRPAAETEPSAVKLTSPANENATSTR